MNQTQRALKACRDAIAVILKDGVLSEQLARTDAKAFDQLYYAFSMDADGERGLPPIRRSIDEGDAAQLRAALVPHVERIIEADIRPVHTGLLSGVSLWDRCKDAQGILRKKESEHGLHYRETEWLTAIQCYLSVHQTVGLLDQIERDPACIWRIASGRAA